MGCLSDRKMCLKGNGFEFAFKFSGIMTFLKTEFLQDLLLITAICCLNVRRVTGNF